jgi:HEPN domain-containing protein
VDYLRERKEAIYENLRDLNFEYLAGKYPEADYTEQRRALEDEAAQTIAEMDALTARGMRSTRARV